MVGGVSVHDVPTCPIDHMPQTGVKDESGSEDLRWASDDTTGPCI